MYRYALGILTVLALGLANFWWQDFDTAFERTFFQAWGIVTYMVVMFIGTYRKT